MVHLGCPGFLRFRKVQGVKLTVTITQPLIVIVIISVVFIVILFNTVIVLVAIGSDDY